MADKSAVRELLKARLRALSPHERARASQAITRHVLALPEYSQARSVMLFVSMAAEADTSGIAAHAWQHGRRVLVPVTNMRERSMEAVEIHSFAEARQRTPVGVLEPAGADPVDPATIDLVLVPGLGFGPAGERIGRGAGFYDHFLLRLATDALTCGLGFELQVMDGIPMTPTDAPLDMLVTETQVRRFRRTDRPAAQNIRN
jgi:5-formyltetrahydrofolate cyclo-ligase